MIHSARNHDSIITLGGPLLVFLHSLGQKRKPEASPNSVCYVGVTSMGGRNTLVFEQKMECHDEAQTSIIFYARTEDRDMGSLAAWRIHELNRARI